MRNRIIYNLMHRAIKNGGMAIVFDRTNVKYFIDYINKQVHLLDLEKSPSMNGGLANRISRNFQKKLIEEENLLIDIIDFEWFCYCSNGFVLSFKDYNVVLLNKKLPWLHKPFLDAIEQKEKRE